MRWILSFSESAENNSYFLLCDGFYVSCTFFKFQSCTTPNQYSPLWVSRESTFEKVRHFILPFLPWLMSFVHSASLSLVRRPTIILRQEWRDNSSLNQVPERSSISCFTMILMTPAHFACLSLVKLTTSILHYERRGNWVFQKAPETTRTSNFTTTFMSFVHSASLNLCDAQRVLSVMRETRINFSESERDISYFLFLRWLFCLLYILHVRFL